MRNPDQCCRCGRTGHSANECHWLQASAVEVIAVEYVDPYIALVREHRIFSIGVTICTLTLAGVFYLVSQLPIT